MNKILVAVFDTEPAAFEGQSALKELHESGDITLYATAVIVKDAAGTVGLKQAVDEGPIGTGLGLLTGSLIGLLAGPVGVAVGASVGALTGLLVDLGESGIGMDFVDEVAKTLSPSKVAVLAEVEETWVTPVDTRLGQLGAVVFRHQRSEIIEDQLNREAAAWDAELKQLEEEMRQADAETKATVQKKIEAVRKKLAATQAAAEARLEQTQRETDAKIETMRVQMKQASDRKKARIEKRMAEVKAAQAASSAKLEQVRKRVKEALTS
jgi:uncharacterized membrane protein